MPHNSNMNLFLVADGCISYIGTAHRRTAANAGRALPKPRAIVYATFPKRFQLFRHRCAYKILEIKWIAAGNLPASSRAWADELSNEIYREAETLRVQLQEILRIDQQTPRLRFEILIAHLRYESFPHSV